MAEKKCPVCKAIASPGELAEIHGEEGSLALTVHHLPVLECSNGHRQFAHPDFPLQLLDQLMENDEAALPAGTPKGLLIKHYHCASCGERLTTAADQARTFHLDMHLPDVAPFDVELTIPVHRCEHCGHEQIHSLKEVRNRTPAALAHAFKGAAIAAPT